MEDLLIGIDVGGTKTRAAAGVPGNRILADRQLKTDASNADTVIGGIIESVSGALRDQTCQGRTLVGIGVGIAGRIDFVNGRVISSPNLPLQRIELKKIISNHFRVPVLIDNDANAAAMGERACGSATTLDDFVLLTLGTGIGAGIYANGRIVRGVHGTAGELGHVIIEPGGPICGCGRHGCLEALASGSAVRRRAVEIVESGCGQGIVEAAGEADAIDARAVAEAARKGDVEALEIFASMAKYLGIGLSNTINVLDPQAIILFGGLLASADLFLDLAIHQARKTALKPAADEVKIINSSLGKDAGILGALFLAREASLIKGA